MTGAEVEVLKDASPAVKRAVAFWQLPARVKNAAVSYMKKDGTVDLEAVAYACVRLEGLGVDPLDNLHETYVIRDGAAFSFGLYAAMQRALLPRAGYRLDVMDVSDTKATGRIVSLRDGWESSPLTLHIDDTDLRVYAKRNARNYAEKPRRMLEARLTTELISLYASDAVRAVARAAGFDMLDSGSTVAGEGAPVGPDLRDDGSTIPAHLRRPPLPDQFRQSLIDRIDRLREVSPDQLAQLSERIKPLHIPPLRTDDPQRRADLKLDDGWLLHYLIREVEAGDVPAFAWHELPPDADVSQTDPPEAVHDDAPEARGLAAEDDDPERPFD